MTLEEAIWKEEALAYSFGERYKRLGEPVGDLQELEAEHRQYAEWLRKLKKYEESIERIKELINDYKGCDMWDTANGLQFALECLEVKADDRDSN